MAYEQRENSGSLFRAKEKKNEKWPDYEGTALIDGQEFWLSAWLKDGKNGKFLSLAFKPKEQRREAQQSDQGYAKASGGNPATRELDDEIPF